MTVRGELLYMLETVARAIGDDLRAQLVFVGGCATALLVSDPITREDVRMTNDVDLIVSLAGYNNWVRLQEHLLKRGFSVSAEDAVICRLRLGLLKVDFMPDDENILGFSNRWYKRGIETAVAYDLAKDLEIRHLTAPYFVATKLEAYRGRGNDDPLGSHDLEDVLILIDGRAELLTEVLAADADVRHFIAETLRAILRHRDFDNFIDGNIAGSTGRIDLVRDRIEALADCDEDH